MQGLCEEIKNLSNVKFETKNNLIKDFQEIWADNGDYISLQYCGTKSVITNVTKKGKRGITGYLSSYITTVDRYLNAKLLDKFKQICIDCLLQNKEFEYKDCNLTITY